MATTAKPGASTPKTTRAKTARKTPAKTATKTAGKRASKRTVDTTPAPAPEATTGQSVTLRGRSVFLVQTTPAGVTVRTAWMSEDKSLRDMPAVFPDVDYAINLIDDLKRQVLKHFSQAAQVGAQAIAKQRAAKKAAPDGT